MTKFPTLYKKDTKGKIRVWWIEQNEDQYRVISGLQDGKLVDSDWKTAVPKNVGKVNATTGTEQAVSQIESLYEKQKNQGKYVESLDDVDQEGYFEPMLAKKWTNSDGTPADQKLVFDAFKNQVRVFTQPKLDGIRCTFVNGKLYSRDGEERVSCPHVIEDLKALHEKHPDLVLDGELYNHEYHDNFNKLQSLILQKKVETINFVETKEKVQYHVYDIFDKANPKMDFETRNALINHLNKEDPFGPSIHLVSTREVFSVEEIDFEYGNFLGEGYEGQMLRINGPYENKRSKYLIKRKEFYDEEFVIVDIIEGQGNWNGKAKAVKFKAGADDDRSYDDLPKAGISGTEAELAELLRNKGKYLNGEVTIRFANKTPGGDPRFGVAKAFYEGKRKD